MPKSVSLQEMSALMEETLCGGGKVVFTPSGHSMRPLLRNRRDRIVLAKPSGKLKKYDIILYRRADGRFVLHRVMAIKEEGYVLCGDHQWRIESAVKHDQIIAVVRALYRDERYIDCQTDWTYRLYCLVWIALLPIRRLYFKAKGRISRWGRKFLAG